MRRRRIASVTWVACAVFGAAGWGAREAAAATVADANLFHGAGVSGINVATSTGFSNAAFVSTNLVDGTNSAFVFAANNNELVAVSGFNSGIGMLRFFDTPSYTGRTSPTVKIYYSATSQTSLTPASYTQLLGPGTGGAFTIPVQTSNVDFYTTDTSPADHPNPGDPNVNTSATIHYSDLSGLGIPAGTRSVLLDFSRTSGFGDGLTEIQAFATPEPASLGLLCVAAAGLLARLRRL